MKYICIYSSIILIALSSCTNQNNKIEQENVVFSDNVTTSYSIIDTDFLLSYPFSLLLTDNYIIVLDEKGHHNYFHILDKKTGLLLSEFGSKGVGPNEILSFTNNPVLNSNSSDLQFFDVNNKKIFRQNIDRNELKGQSLNAITRKDPRIFIQEIFAVDNYYLAMGCNSLLDKNRFVVFDSAFQKIAAFGDYPVLDNNHKKNKELWDDCFSMRFFKFSPNRKKAVFASYKMGFIEFFDLTGLPNVITGTKSLLLTNPKNSDDEIIWGFEDVFATDQFVYALQNGKPLTTPPYYSESIKVFDWAGSPIVEYNTGLDMRCLAVDEAENTIYVVAHDIDNGFFLAKINDIDAKQYIKY